jgi:histidinol-phosphate aminotransferase
MKITPKKFVNYIPRTPHWLVDRQGYYTMERNERVDEFSQSIMKKIFSQINSFDLRTYPDTDKIYKEVAKWQKVRDNQIILTEGADGGLLRVFKVFISGGDKVITCNPSFAMYPIYCDMFGAKHHPINLKVKNYDFFSEIKKHIKKVKPKLVAIANPNQPIEIMLNLKQIGEICKLAKKYNSLVIIDEAYYHFNNVTAKNLINKFENLIVVRTFSKAFGLAGMRIGYTMSNKKIIGYMLSIKPIYEINAVNIKLVRFFLKNLNIMKNYVAEVAKSRILFKNSLKKHNIEVVGKYSNTVLFKLKDNNQVKKIIKYLYKKKFIIRPMTIDGDNSYIRATIGGVKIMKNFLKQFDIGMKKFK